MDIREINDALDDLRAIGAGHIDTLRCAENAETALRKLANMLPATLNLRRCRDCKGEAYHADNITPYVLCPRCGSKDTRLIRTP